MLTKNETTALTLSPTKKDFVQIWNELLEVAGKLSERWDPTSTNESDPGIVILKALTGIADKLNYNIDKNTLEAFMPTAAQEDSMRKLCDMLGYNIKYYRSAVTDVTIRWYNPEPSGAEKIAVDNGLLLPKFTVLTNSDNTISYFTTNQVPYYISSTSPKLTVECMEGQVIKCESINDNNVIAINQITNNNRFYLPETHIAENGIFIYNVRSIGDGTMEDGTRWTKVDNLNTQVRGSRVFKFGYDSFEGRPYIEFPEDYSELFDAGIFIYYTRTNGINGNISPRTLTQMELPSLTGWSDVSADSFNIENVFAATTGANIETISQAYNNFKKTIGTFDTLVTCRDYMNKIYSLLNPEDKPYVSNILVTDIRNDLNRAITICSCDGAGIFYKEKPLVTVSYNSVNKPIFVDDAWYIGSKNGIVITADTVSSFFENAANFDTASSGQVSVENGLWTIKQNDTTFVTKLAALKESVDNIDHFDLVFYPFKTYNQVRSNVKDIKAAYDSSFTYDSSAGALVEQVLKDEQLQLVAHKVQKPRIGDILSINNYLKLNALISTNAKLTVDEGTLLVDKIKIALANAFNMRELDFGEEIPFDSILEVIETADSRIRVVSLAEPALYTTFSVLKDYKEDGTPILVEYGVASDNWLTADYAKTSGRFKSENKNEIAPLKYFNTNEAKQYYNKLVIRNILAGRIPLFNYNKTFTTNFAESPYLATSLPDSNPGVPELEDVPITIYTENGAILTAQHCDFGDVYTKTVQPYAPQMTGNSTSNITEVKASCQIPAVGSVVRDVTLHQGEYVKFRAPNFITKKTYPAYVNYHLQLNKELNREPVGAVGSSLFSLMNADLIKNEQQNIPGFSYDDNAAKVAWQKAIDYFLAVDYAKYGDPANDALLIEDLAQLAERKKARLVKEFTLTQKISAFKQTGLGADSSEPIANKDIVISIPENPSGENAATIAELMASCGCMRIKNNLKDEDYTAQAPTEGGFIADLAWDTADAKAYDNVKNKNSVLPSGYEILIALKQGGIINPFVTATDTFNDIKTEVNARLEELRYLTDDSGNPILPTECDWTISFTFQYVPINAASLDVWSNFLQDHPTVIEGNEVPKLAETDKLKFDFDSSEAVFWRKFGSGYTLGKYVENSEDRGKYLKFTENYFSSISNNVTEGLYLLHVLGQDAIPNEITNGTDYELLNGECLYIEYTPSTTTAEGVSETLPPVTEQYGQGTIIRPQGFETGLIDSTVKQEAGTSYAKHVTFKTNTNSGSEDIGMFSFGANEQVEIRDFARVVLKNKTVPSLWVYKNFDCDILENWDRNDKNVCRKYTLKDGEYIFYTDQDKSELAFFTTGTCVELYGSVVIHKADKIDIASILDNGIKDIPWQFVAFANSTEKIVFQEYQYITLGVGDKIGELTLMPDPDDVNAPSPTAITSEWAHCDNKITYYLASAPTSPAELSPVSLASTTGSGWEVCSLLELEAAPSNLQTLRVTDKVSTSLTITTTETGGNERTVTITPTELGIVLNDEVGATAEADAEQEQEIAYPLSFKTNLKCQANSDTLNINDPYANTKNLSSLQLKVFAKNPPSIVTTVHERVIPPTDGSTIFDFAKWSGEPIAEKSPLEIWSFVDLDKLKYSEKDNCDHALLLSANIIANTYGIACIYVSYTSEHAASKAKTWIEVIPGTNHEDFMLINADKTTWIPGDAAKNLPDKLELYPGINCLRINKTCKFFIKTSEESQGTLLFDDLRLVDTSPLNYDSAVTADKNNKLADAIDQLTDTLSPDDNLVPATNGLNLAQLSYLPILDNQEDLDQAVEQAQTEVITKALNNASTTLISTVRPLIENCASDALVALDMTREKLARTVEIDHSEFASSIFNSFNSTTDNNNLSKLINSRNVLNTFSNTGKQVLNILDRASTVSAVRTPLAKIQADLTNPFSQDIKVDLLGKLQKTLDQIRSAEIGTDTPSDVAKTLLDFFVDKRILKEVRIETLNKLKADITAMGKAEHRQYISDLIDSIQSPAAYENNQKILAAIQELKESILLEDSSPAVENAVLRLEQLVGTENISRLRTAISTLRRRLEVELEHLGANSESSARQNTIKNCLAELDNFEQPLLEYEANTLSNITLSNTMFDEDGNAFRDFVSDVLQTNEFTFIEQERARLEGVFSALTEAITKDYSDDYELIISNLTKIRIELLKDPVNLSFDEVFEANKDALIGIMLPAIARMSPALPSRHGGKRTELITNISELISGITKNDLDLVKQTAAIYNPTDEKWSDAELLLDLSSEVIESLTHLYKQINSRLNDAKNSASLVTEVGSIISAIGTETAIANQLKDIGIAKQDPLYLIIHKIITAASEQVVDTEQIAILTEDLRSMVKNTDTVLALIKERFTAVVSEILEDVLAINSTSAILTCIIELFLQDKEVLTEDSLQNTIDASFEKEQELLTKLEALTSIQDFVINNNSFSEIIVGLNNTINTPTDSDLGLLKAISGWPVIKPTISRLVIVNQDLAKLAAVRTELSKSYSDVQILRDWLTSTFKPSLPLDSLLLPGIRNLEATLSIIDFKAKDLPTVLTKTVETRLIEEQLLRAIREIDVDRDFYYNVQVEDSLAIDINESTVSLNTLMNPLANYSINNINNSFVISKLDIDHLSDGLQLAKSSRLI